jgi:glutathione peroxidase
MKHLLILASFLLSLSAEASSVYSEKITLLDGSKKETTLEVYRGKPILLVNIATKCGYTKQLDGLEKLYSKYKARGLVVLGVPSNDFGGQTPENDGEVKKFCKLRYGVTFPLTSKVVVKGDAKHPLIAKLIAKDNQEIAWNFEKFLIDKDGSVISRYKSTVKPEDKVLSDDIEKAL